MAPFRMILLLLAISHHCTSQTCLSEGITFINQAQIDSFPLLYPNCSTIVGDVKIGDFSQPYMSTDIIDLSGLNTVFQINGSLNIFYNTALVNLSGLSNLTYVGASVIIDNNDALIDLQGLENLTSINGFFTVKSNENLISLSGLENVSFVDNNLYISTNPALISFDGLGGLNNINGYMSIANNDALVNFQGLGALSSIGGFVHIWSNDELVNLEGLEALSTVGGFVAILKNNELNDVNGISNLQSIGSYLSIHDNAMLSSIEGIGNIDPESINAPSFNQNDIELYNNQNLSSCALDNVCSVFNTPNSKMLIYNNGEDCSSMSDIDSICNPTCGMVNTKNSSGVGSLTYVLDCIETNDTIFIDASMAGDTIWLSESTLDVQKSFVLKGPNSKILIASTMESPLVKIYADEQVHLINVDLFKFYPVSDTIIYNEGTLILEDINIFTNSHQIIQSDIAQMKVKGNTHVMN